MLNKGITIIISFIAAYSLAQTSHLTEIKRSSFYDFKTMYELQIIGKSEGNYFILFNTSKKERNKNHIAKLDHNLNIASTYEIPGINEKDVNVLHAAVAGEQILTFYTSNGKLYSRNFSVNSETFAESSIELMPLKSKSVFITDFKSAHASNDSRLGVAFTGAETVYAMVFDSAGKVLWAKDHETIGNKLSELTFLDKNTLFFNCQNPELKETFTRSKINFTIPYYGTSKGIIQIPIQKNQGTVQKTQGFDTDQIVTTGWYKDQKKDISIGYFGRKSSTKNDSTEVFVKNDISDELFWATIPLLSLKVLKSQINMNHFEFTHILSRNDGGYYFLGEEKFKTITESRFPEPPNAEELQPYFKDPSDRAGTAIPSINQKDILAISVSSEGKIEWEKRIPKHQRGRYTKEHLNFSFTPIVTERGLTILFNGRNENLDYEYGQTVKMYFGQDKKANVTMVRINSKGEIIREPLFFFKEWNTFIYQGLYTISEDNTLFFYAPETKGFRFAEYKIY
jgi:hypothetical protein